MTSVSGTTRKPLVLPMKGKWFDMILTGEKSEEYRLFKPYWRTRVANWLAANGMPPMEMDGDYLVKLIRRDGMGYWNCNAHGHPMPILFVNGYGKCAPRFVGWCDAFSIRADVRCPEWGEAEYKGKPHFSFHICRVELERKRK